jgi:hypothetical protein
MRANGVVTPKGRYLPFTIEAVPQRQSLLERLRDRTRQAAARAKAAPASRVAWPMRVSVGPLRASVRSLRASYRPPRAGNYAHVLERTRAFDTAATIARAVTADASESEAQPTA